MAWGFLSGNQWGTPQACCQYFSISNFLHGATAALKRIYLKHDICDALCCTTPCETQLGSILTVSHDVLTAWHDTNFQCSWNRAQISALVLSHQHQILECLGVDVMITIFCDFLQFSAKKLAFFSKTNATIKFFAFSVKNDIFWRKYFKNHNIGPRSNLKSAKHWYL
jgi:hypothetical protein